MAIDLERLQSASVHLPDVVVDPARWVDLLEEIANAAGAMGAGLIPPTGTTGAIASRDLRDCLDSYMRDGWHDGKRDTRKRAMDLLRRRGVALDQELAAPDLSRPSPFLDEFLPRFGGKWWAGIGLRSGPEFWCLALHRSPRGGQFDHTDKAILQQFSSRLNEVGNLSYVVGHRALSEVADAFDRIHQAVVAIDESGKVIRANAAAEGLFGDALRCVAGRLVLADRDAAAAYDRLLGRLRRAPEGKALRAAPITVRAENGSRLVLEALPVDGAARSPFLHARALLLLKEFGKAAEPDWQVLRGAFNLTPAEARLAVRIASGESLSSAAEALRITKESARTRLKSVFQKTDVHRQAELVILVTSLLRSV